MIRSACAVCIFLALCPALGRAQVLVGRVVEREGGTPLAGALVVTGGRSVVTGPDGYFELAARPGVPRTLRVERLGYATVDTLWAADADTVRMDLALDLLPVMIPGLIVNAPPGRAFEHLGGEVRVRPPDRMVIARGIGLDPVEQIAGSGIASSESDFSALPVVRAARWDQTALYLGALRIWGPLHGLGLVGPAKISGTEELRVSGAVPSVFDANATGGRIEALPRLGRDAPWAEGGATLLDVSMSAGGPLGEGGTFVVTGTRSTGLDFLGSMVGGDLPLRYESVEGHARWRWSGRFEGRAAAYTSRDSVSFAAASFSENLDSRWNTMAWSLGGRWQAAPRDALDLEITRSTYDAELATLVGGERMAPSANTLSDLRAAGSWIHEGRRASLLARLDLSRVQASLDSDSTRPGPAMRDDGHAESLGFAVGIETVSGRSALRGGVRVDAVRGLGLAVQPRADWTRELAREWRVHASAGRATQWVSALNAEAVIPQAPAWWVHAAPHGWAVADNLALGATGPLLSWARVRGEVFVRRSTGLPRWTAAWNGTGGIVQEDGRAAGMGVDLALWDSHAASVRWDHTLAWASVGEERRAPAWDIRHSGNLQIGWRPERWEFAASLSYSSGRPLPVPVGAISGLEIDARHGLHGTEQYTLYSDHAQRLPAYVRLDAGLSREFDVGQVRVQASVKMLNVTDRANVLFYQLGNVSLKPLDVPFLDWYQSVGQRLYPERQFRRLLSVGLNAKLR